MQKTWWKESVIYQIYPRSFYDSNDHCPDSSGRITDIEKVKAVLNENSIDTNGVTYEELEGVNWS